MTPLILAAKQSHGDLMRYFVAEANADVNIQAEKVTSLITQVLKQNAVYMYCCIVC